VNKKKKLSAHIKYINAQAERIKLRLNTSIENEKMIQEAVFECLDEYINGNLEEFPKDIAVELRTSMRDILWGITPDLFKTHKGIGERTYSPTVNDCIEAAVRYIRFAKAGLIDDKSPNKTIKEEYGVAKSTVSTWLNHKNFSHIKSPQSSDVTKDEIEAIVRFMTFHGKNYANFPTSSSHKAIRIRVTKK